MRYNCYSTRIWLCPSSILDGSFYHVGIPVNDFIRLRFCHIVGPRKHRLVQWPVSHCGHLDISRDVSRVQDVDPRESDGYLRCRVQFNKVMKLIRHCDEARRRSRTRGNTRQVYDKGSVETAQSLAP